ncbi:hypothetical protein LY13_004811 [Prauserella aidingensis]|nr:hypothetical protein [Prauserella aidingensis]
MWHTVVILTHTAAAVAALGLGIAALRTDLASVHDAPRTTARIVKAQKWVVGRDEPAAFHPAPSDHRVSCIAPVWRRSFRLSQFLRWCSRSG